MATFTHSRPMPGSFHEALTIDAVRHFAPSAFALAPHESRSARYTYIPTSEVIAGLVKEGFAPFKAAQSRSRIAGKAEFTKHMLRFRHAESQAVDGLYPEVVLINSHDGTSAYKLFAGIFRAVCANGLISGEKWAELSVQHKGNIVQNVIEGSFQIVGRAARSLDTTQAWKALRLSAQEQTIFADAARDLRFAERDGTIRTPIASAQLLAPRRWEDAGEFRGAMNQRLPKSDLFTTMNVVQENVIRGGITARSKDSIDSETNRRTRGRRVTTRAVAGIDQDVKLNRALWMLAERMAELKAA